MENTRVVLGGKLARSVNMLVRMSDSSHEQIIKALLKAGLKKFSDDMKEEVMKEAAEVIDVWRN